MNDDELRGLIRAAIRKHMGAEAVGPKPDAAGLRELPPQPPPLAISFAQYQLHRADGDTMCIIEPAVQCNHCGFCKCHGH
jgi:hypothetical protein